MYQWAQEAFGAAGQQYGSWEGPACWMLRPLGTCWLWQQQPWMAWRPSCWTRCAMWTAWDRLPVKVWPSQQMAGQASPNGVHILKLRIHFSSRIPFPITVGTWG